MYVCIMMQDKKKFAKSLRKAAIAEEKNAGTKTHKAKQA